MRFFEITGKCDKKNWLLANTWRAMNKHPIPIEEKRIVVLVISFLLNVIVRSRFWVLIDSASASVMTNFYIEDLSRIAYGGMSIL